ncbi:putative phytosulfokines 6 [Glycine soja]|nr:putative phytosulfokines 6 [Glycine max]
MTTLVLVCLHTEINGVLYTEMVPCSYHIKNEERLLHDQASSRLLEPLKGKGPRQGEKEVEVNENAIPQSSDMEELIGSEECYMKDEECTSRRMMVEAHLDYIYTQHHKH